MAAPKAAPKAASPSLDVGVLVGISTKNGYERGVITFIDSCRIEFIQGEKLVGIPWTSIVKVEYDING